MEDDREPPDAGDDKIVELRPGQKGTRKRLSTIDYLPADVRRELDRAIEDGRLKVDDLWVLVREKGGDVSRSAVARYKVREERNRAIFKQAQDMAAFYARERERDPHGPVSQLNNELTKTMVFQRLMAMSPKDAEKADPKDLALLASAVRSAAATDKLTTERENMIARRAVEKQAAEQKAALATAEKKGDIDKAAAQRAREILGFA